MRLGEYRGYVSGQVASKEMTIGISYQPDERAFIPCSEAIGVDLLCGYDDKADGPIASKLTFLVDGAPIAAFGTWTGTDIFGHYWRKSDTTRYGFVSSLLEMPFLPVELFEGRESLWEGRHCEYIDSSHQAWDAWRQAVRGCYRDYGDSDRPLLSPPYYCQELARQAQEETPATSTEAIRALRQGAVLTGEWPGQLMLQDAKHWSANLLAGLVADADWWARHLYRTIHLGPLRPRWEYTYLR